MLLRLISIAAMLGSWLPLTAATISGHLDVYAEGRPLRSDQAVQAIVYFRPKQPPQPVPVTPTQIMSTEHKQFVPQALATTVGSGVRFPNRDPILHNVFSPSGDNAFDLGLYGRGDGRTVTFSHVGFVRVYCNVHHSMVGHILVLDTPYFTRPDAQGNFTLDVGDSGPGDIVIWHERARAWHTQIVPAETAPLKVRLDLTQRRVPRHMNKFGKPYGRDRNGY